MNNQPRIGFYVRNAFQAGHFRPLFRETKNAVWVAKTSAKLHAAGIVRNEPCITSRLFLRRKIDKHCDVLLTQGLPPQGVQARAKCVMVQYGYAKEPYNFGEWRRAGDLILAYGDYAQQRFAPHAKSVAIGNPRWDDWQDPAFLARAKTLLSTKLNPALKTVVYAPTWGELSSMPDWLDTITALSGRYNVLVKGHHNSIRDGEMNVLKNSDTVHFLPDADLFALMAVSDVMISDLSGAIFDAVLCKLPVVLVAPKNLAEAFGKKLDANSIEIAHRNEFGTVLDNPSDIDQALDQAINNGSQVSDAWHKSLFHCDGRVSENFQAAIKTLNV